jgi:hypothetical protein
VLAAFEGRLAALSAVMEGRAAGVPAEVLQGALDQVHAGLGPQLGALISVLESPAESQPPGSSA